MSFLMKPSDVNNVFLQCETVSVFPPMLAFRMERFSSTMCPEGLLPFPMAVAGL